MAKMKITQLRSRNGATERQISTLRALGLRRINHTVERDADKITCGMVEKVRHLIRVEEI
jgi:large subunit ribosomal protein L30